MGKVTVVIPNLNGIKYIETCLDSLIDRTKQEIAIIVVDNGSSDGSYELVRDKYTQDTALSPIGDYIKLRLIRMEENTGFCHAVNIGIKEADTPYVILLNNDTEVLEGFVENLVLKIEAEKGLFSVSACMLMLDKPELIDSAGDRYCALGWAYSRGKGKPASKYGSSARIFSACGGAAIYRKEVFDKIGLFDELHFAYLEDVDIGYRSRIYGYLSSYEPKARVLHAGSAYSGSRHNSFKINLSSANNVYIIWKNMPLLQWIWNFPLLLTGFFLKIVYFSVKKMGMIYLKGIWRGFIRCCRESANGKNAKIPFCWKNLGNYFAIQLQLYVNILRMPFGK